MGDLFPPEVDVVVTARPTAIAATAAETLTELTELARRAARWSAG
jgi:RNase P protein component